MNSVFVSSVAMYLMFGFAMFGAIDLLTSVSVHVQEWLRAKRNINTEVPALSASVRDLQTRLSLLESEIKSLRLSRRLDAVIGKG